MINPDGTSGGGTGGSNSPLSSIGEKLAIWFENITSKQVVYIIVGLVVFFFLTTLI